MARIVLLCVHLTIASCYVAMSASNICHTDIEDSTLLDCSYKDLTSIPENIPSTITKLDLEGNRITTAGLKFPKLPKLQHLILTFNPIHVIDRTTFKNIPNLKTLSMQFINISSIDPGGFAELRKLQNLTLSSGLQNIPSKAFQGLVRLEFLDLSLMYALESIALDAFSDLHNLKYLYLNNDRTLAVIDTAVFQNLSNLKHLYLSNDKLSEIPRNICQHLPMLHTLVLKFNIEISSAKIEGTCANLAHFALDYANITIVNREDFQATSGTVLDELSFYQTPLHEIEVGTFAGARINRFSFGHKNSNIENILKGLTDSNTTQIAISKMGSDLYSLTNSTFSVAMETTLGETLRQLSISSTYLHTVEDFAFIAFPNLKELNLTHNQIETFGKDAFANLIFLETLNLETNYISQIPDGLFNNLNNLRYLNLYGNQIKYLNKGIFDNLFKLQEFVFGGQRVSMIIADPELFSHLSNLQTISITENLIGKGFEFRMSDFTKLRRLNLEKISAPYSTILYGCENGTNLEEISVNGSRWLVGNIDSHIECLSSVRKFSISGVYPPQPWTECSRDLHPRFYFVQNVEELIMSYNDISDLDDGCFELKNKLIHLDLSNNKMRLVRPGMWKGLEMLEVLDLRNNGITMIEHTAFQTLPSLKRLYLGRNPFTCDCDLRWIQNQLSVQRPPEYQNWIYWLQDYQCTLPKTLHGTYVMDYHPFFFTCSLMAKVGLIAGSAVILFAIITAILRHYRYHISYIWFRLTRRYRGYRPLEGDEYDAYISHSEDMQDIDWICNTLVPRLENEFNFRITFREREIRAGRSKIKNSIEAIQQSKYTVFVFSEKALECGIFMFELRIAYYKLIEEKIDVIIIVELENIPHNKLTDELQVLFYYKDVIKWTDNFELGKRHFWDQIRHQIQRRQQNDIIML